MKAIGKPDRRGAIRALVGVVFVLGISDVGLGTWLSPGNSIGARLGREAVWWAIGALMLFWVLRIERLPLSSIGLRRPTWGTLGWGLAATAALMATVMLSYAVILPALGLSMNQRAVDAITAAPWWFQMLMLLRAGVVEEILYRGYPIERIESLTGSRWLAAVLPGLVFIATHYAFWGAGQLIVVAFGTLVFTLLYLWRRDLVCCMIAHILVDWIGFALAQMPR